MFETNKAKFALCILAGMTSGMLFVLLGENTLWKPSEIGYQTLSQHAQYLINRTKIIMMEDAINLTNGSKVSSKTTTSTTSSTTRTATSKASSTASKTSSSTAKASSSKLFLVDTPNCKIPDLNPNDPSLRGVVKAGVVLHCNKFRRFTYDKGDTVYVDLDAINKSQYKGRFGYCTLTPIVRPVTQTSDHNALTHLPPGPKFTNSIKVTHDHFRALCYDKNGRQLFENYHSIIHEKKEVEERCKTKMATRAKERPDVKENLSVLTIVVDSVSRINSIRFMKKTRNFLLNVLNATDMVGYNKVGYGTFHNMIPATTGKFYGELPWSFEKPNIFDKYRFIWDDYASQGFRTYYAEDYPFGALFDYKKPGFRKNPADYYNRHLFLSMYQHKSTIVYNEENCILDKLQTDWVLDPAYKFLLKFKKQPYFCFQLITRLTHDYLERTKSADDIYYNYLKKAHDDGILDNAVLVFTADHGMRFGDIRKWYIGLMEERLPMLYISLPKWFREKYPQSYENLKINSRRLTTPLDFYEFYNDLLYFTGKDRQEGGVSPKGKKRAYSFFSKMPLERSCNDADIESHWCTCAGLEVVDVSTTAVKNAAKFFIDTINGQLSKYKSVCEYLSIDVINSAYKVKPSSKTLVNTLTSHKISFTAKPGGGAFEGTVTYDSRKRLFKLGSEISRINAYGHEKRCSVRYEEERLCYCKSNRS